MQALSLLDKFGGYVYLSGSGERVHINVWLHHIYLTEIYGVYTPTMGGWS